GVELFTDAVRVADVDNPKGYHELELVKSLKSQSDKRWLAAAEGRVIKVISSLLRDLPGGRAYRVVFMNRNLDEVLASQNTMRTRLGDCAPVSDAELRDLYGKHLAGVKRWLASQRNFQLLDVDYADAIA